MPRGGLVTLETEGLMEDGGDVKLAYCTTFIAYLPIQPKISR